ncbi:MAG: DNA mismatch repair protein MutS [Candidatus Eisenbacteria bacterium]|nr:DNA mismatch repair protein MutS [Candidatus Eisenbacteria bacterium]
MDAKLESPGARNKRAPGTSTPVMEQYVRMKATYRDSILFFRMGDFYEMFYEDAKLASKVLGLTLTSRGRIRGEAVPLAGIPWHAADGYIAKLLKCGYKVAVCEQLEKPSPGKKLVKRDVVEVITPGTVLSDNLLDEKESVFLASIFPSDERYGIAIADVATGDFMAGETDVSKINDELSRFSIREVLLPEEFSSSPEIPRITGKSSRTFIDGKSFDYERAKRLLKEQLSQGDLHAFGCDDLRDGIRAAGALIHYLRELKRSDLSHFDSLKRLTESSSMFLDETTLRNLEILKSPYQGGRSLAGVLDRTLTPMGSRTLRAFLVRPLLETREIVERHDAVEELVTDSLLRGRLRDFMKSLKDTERFVGKLAFDRINPNELFLMGETLKVIPEIRLLLENRSSALLRDIELKLGDHSEYAALLSAALVPNPPMTLSEGGIIREGFNKELDELRMSSKNAKHAIAELERKEREITGVPNLRIGYNRVFGYYFEVTKSNLKKVPEYFERKQTLTGLERFTTEELRKFESQVLGAEEKANSLEIEGFERLKEEGKAKIHSLKLSANALAQLDALASLAEVAAENSYARPSVDASNRIEIEEGRHPVVEKTLPRGEFVPNDTTLDSSSTQIAIVTGPNMAGKSTYLRQVGLIIVMAQAGSFVPAKKASIGVVDRIFTRVGSSDEITTGRSTFMVEMNEMASITRNATGKSLILLDEIGRGTSTFDGMSLAWAITEFLHGDEGFAPRTLFATHYQELTELPSLLPRVVNLNVVVKEWGDELVFIRKIEEGASDRSYGIQVAKLAGLPGRIVERAKEVLRELEREGAMRKKAMAPKDAALELQLFDEKESELIRELERLDTDEMTPIDALNALARLRKEYGKKE